MDVKSNGASLRSAAAAKDPQTVGDSGTLLARLSRNTVTSFREENTEQKGNTQLRIIPTEGC